MTLDRRTLSGIASLAIGCSLALIVVLGGACSSDATDSQTPVRMGYLPMISSLTYFVALDQQFFEDEGVEIVGVPIKTSNSIADALESGTIEVGVELSVIPLFNKVLPNRSSSFLIFSTSAITKVDGFDGVIVGAESEIESFEDLSGKKVAVFPGTTATNTLLDVFAGSFPNLPPPIPMAMLPTLHLPELANGEVDAAHAYEPFLSTGLIKQGMRQIHTSLYAEQVNPSPIGVAAISRKFLDEDSDRAEKILRALDRAVDFIEAYPDKTRMIVSEYTGVDAEVADALNFMPMSKSSRIDMGGLEEYSRVLLRMGEIQEIPPVASLCYSGQE